MVEERRRIPRYRIDAEIAVNDGCGRTIDLSANSVYFESPSAFVIGEEVALVFPFEHVAGGASVHCTARVVRVDPRGALFGVAASYQPVAFSVATQPALTAES